MPSAASDWSLTHNNSCSCWAWCDQDDEGCVVMCSTLTNTVARRKSLTVQAEEEAEVDEAPVQVAVEKKKEKKRR